MEFSNDAEQKTNKIVSHSLILILPAYYNFHDYLAFNPGVSDE